MNIGGGRQDGKVEGRLKGMVKARVVLDYDKKGGV